MQLPVDSCLEIKDAADSVFVVHSTGLDVPGDHQVKRGVRGTALVLDVQVVAAKLSSFQVEVPALLCLLLFCHDYLVLVFKRLHKVESVLLGAVLVAIRNVALGVEVKVVVRHLCLNLNKVTAASLAVLSSASFVSTPSSNRYSSD